MAKDAPQSALLNPEALAGLHALDVAARAVVDGLHAGSHKSPFKGHSVDFADHRPYVPGDDLRHLDWKVLGRRDRLVLKRYETETDLGCTLVVDGSGSMAYRHEDSALSKYSYAAMLAASMAYLVIQQQDRVGLVIFSEDRIHERRPARQDQFLRVCTDLQNHQPQLGTDARKAVNKLAAASYSRGLIIVFSDCFTDLDALTATLDSLRHRGHDVALMWVLDRAEVDFTVPTVSRFQGLESEGEVVAEPRALAQAYRAEVAKQRMQMEKICRARRVILIETVTDEAPQHPLNRLLVALQRE